MFNDRWEGDDPPLEGVGRILQRQRAYHQRRKNKGKEKELDMPLFVHGICPTCYVEDLQEVASAATTQAESADSLEMFTKAHKQCGCATDCRMVAYGIGGRYTLGMHFSGGYKVAMCLDAVPFDDPEFKFHMDYWFSKHARDYLYSFFNPLNREPKENCDEKCEVLTHGFPTFYSPQPPCKCLEGLERKYQYQKWQRERAAGTHKKKATSDVGKMFLMSPSLCSVCLTAQRAAQAEAEAASKAASEAAAAAAAAAATAAALNSTSNATPGPSSSNNAPTPPSTNLPDPHREQTCFCDFCTGTPPARYARIDDSDLEDE
ncbi:hypothetical protein Q8F55_008557 [Vanrija albida]|uniref:CxC2-like cysteine cluster KDZ transposase-associated domain-containing protein n=1 Tax=Vanrija albida TaxID=181172 RepID=A0ABR3PRC6_9TREE